MAPSHIPRLPAPEAASTLEGREKSTVSAGGHCLQAPLSPPHAERQGHPLTAKMSSGTRKMACLAQTSGLPQGRSCCGTGCCSLRSPVPTKLTGRWHYTRQATHPHRECLGLGTQLAVFWACLAWKALDENSARQEEDPTHWVQWVEEEAAQNVTRGASLTRGHLHSLPC